MAEIDESLVRHVATLARLKPDDAEVASMTRELTRIVGYIDCLNELDTDSVEPMAHPLALRNVFRADEVRASISAEEAVGNAPERERTFFKVPKVLDTGGGA